MNRILFIDDVHEGGIARFEKVGLPEKVGNLKNVSVDFRSSILNVIVTEDENGNIMHNAPEFENFDLVFLHTSYDKPTVGPKAISDLLDVHENKLYCFAGRYIPDRNGLGRTELYQNFVGFVKMINNYGQTEMSILLNGPTYYLESRYEELIGEIDDIDRWESFLTENWWFILQDYFKLSSDEISALRVECKNFEFFSELDNRLREVKNQSHRRLFL